MWKVCSADSIPWLLCCQLWRHGGSLGPLCPYRASGLNGSGGHGGPAGGLSWTGLKRNHLISIRPNHPKFMHEPSDGGGCIPMPGHAQHLVITCVVASLTFESFLHRGSSFCTWQPRWGLGHGLQLIQAGIHLFVQKSVSVQLPEKFRAYCMWSLSGMSRREPMQLWVLCTCSLPPSCGQDPRG